jgi:hypothetical protein
MAEDVLGDIVDSPIDGDPAVVGVAVLGDFF